MWILFNQDGSLSHTISSEPHIYDIGDKTVIQTDQIFEFETKKYTLVNGEIVSEDFIPPPPVPQEPPTVQEKLARAGITIDELKEALGI